MKCNTCGAENPDRAKFCSECGSYLGAMNAERTEYMSVQLTLRRLTKPILMPLNACFPKESRAGIRSPKRLSPIRNRIRTKKAIIIPKRKSPSRTRMLLLGRKSAPVKEQHIISSAVPRAYPPKHIKTRIIRMIRMPMKEDRKT